MRSRARCGARTTCRTTRSTSTSTATSQTCTRRSGGRRRPARGTAPCCRSRSRATGRRAFALLFGFSACVGLCVRARARVRAPPFGEKAHTSLGARAPGAVDARAHTFNTPQYAHPPSPPLSPNQLDHLNYPAATAPSCCATCARSPSSRRTRSLAFRTLERTSARACASSFGAAPT